MKFFKDKMLRISHDEIRKYSDLMTSQRRVIDKKDLKTLFRCIRQWNAIADKVN